MNELQVMLSWQDIKEPTKPAPAVASPRAQSKQCEEKLEQGQVQRV